MSETTHSSRKHQAKKNSALVSMSPAEKISQQDIDALAGYIPASKKVEELFEVILEASEKITDTVGSSSSQDAEKENITPQSNESQKDESTEKAVEDNIEEEYNLEPWKKYQNKSAALETKASDLTVENSSTQLAIKLNLEDGHWTTIRTLLKLDKNTNRANVSMKEFIDAIDQMKGSVIRGSKNVHFAIPNIFSGKIVAVSMHILHGDRAEILPRSTYYWDRAVKLLEKAGFRDYLQQNKR